MFVSQSIIHYFGFNFGNIPIVAIIAKFMDEHSYFIILIRIVTTILDIVAFMDQIKAFTLKQASYSQFNFEVNLFTI